MGGGGEFTIKFILQGVVMLCKEHIARGSEYTLNSKGWGEGGSYLNGFEPKGALI